MRLIDVDAFCAEMKNRQNECAKWRDETDDPDIKIRADGALSAFIECKLTLDKMPTIEPEQRWVPWSSGKFPEESGTYTITAYDGVTKRVTYAKYQKRLKRWELTGARAYWRVLAWMPLPEPYRDGEQDEDR